MEGFGLEAEARMTTWHIMIPSDIEPDGGYSQDISEGNCPSLAVDVVLCISRFRHSNIGFRNHSPLTPALRRQKQADTCKFKAKRKELPDLFLSWVYTQRSKSAYLEIFAHPYVCLCCSVTQNSQEIEPV